MKILLVHNDYGKYSGEEAVVDKMASIFASLGHQTAMLRMSTAGVRDSLAGKIRVFTAGLHSPVGVNAMRRALATEKPDVVNVHNLYPFISPAALRECRHAGIPVVMTVHNFRLICPTGLFMRNGAPCELCLERGNEWGCIRYNCEQSWPKSIAYAARNAVARLRRDYLDCVDRFACITDFQRRKLIRAGFPADKITVIPNPMDLPDMSEDTDNRISQDTDGYVAFCGRISHEKGIDLIIEAARRNTDIPFRLAGAVADPALTADLPANVRLEGYLSGDRLTEFYRNARFMVMASRWYEGFPMAILEAAKYSKPTVAPDHGGFSEIIGGTSISAQNADSDRNTAIPPIGQLFTPGDADSLSSAIRRLWDNPRLTAALGEAALQKLRSNYSTPVIAARWQDLITHIRR